MKLGTKWFHHPPSGSQHTAGGFVTDSADRRSFDAQTVCHVHCSQKWGRLIAAAPELLQTLKGLMDIIDSSRGAAGYRISGTATWEEFEEVEAARRLIDKIRGKS